MKPKHNLIPSFFLFILLNGICLSLSAQVVFNVESATAEQGDHLCLDVNVNNFDKIISAQFTVRWDPAILEFDSVGSFGLQGMSTNNFGLNKVDQGIVSLSWIDFSASGKSVTDGTALFQICFKAIGTSGGSSLVEVSNNPIQIEITDVNSNGDNIGGIVNNGIVTINSSTSVLFFDSTQISLPGHTCNKLTAKGIQSIQKLTGTVAWDPALLAFDSICCLHPGIQYSDISSFQSDNGVLLLNFDKGTSIDLSMNSELFGVCFNAVGKPGDIGYIALNGDWFPYEIKAVPAGPVKLTKGLVNILQKNASFKTTPQKGQTGDYIEYPVISAYPLQLEHLQGSILFDPSKLAYTGFRKKALSSMAEDSLYLGKTSSGQIGFTWSAKNTPLSLAINDTLFFIKYLIIGNESITQLSGSDTIYIQSAIIKNTNSLKLPLVLDTSIVTILPADVQLTGEDAYGETGDTVCVKLFGSGFKNVSGLDLNLVYDPALLKAISVQAVEMPADPAISYTINSGKIRITWNDYPGGSGFSLQAGDALLEACFELKGVAGTTAMIDLDKKTSKVFRSDYLLDSFSIALTHAKITVLGSSILSIQSFIKNNPCEGDNKGEIQVSMDGGKAPFKFIWSDGSNIQNRNSLQDGIYDVSIQDSSIPAQLLAMSFEIKHYAAKPIIISINDVSLKCPLDSIEVDSKAGSQEISWLGNSSGIHPLAGGKAFIDLPGTYIFKLYDINTSCASFDTFNVYPAPILESANAGVDQQGCEEVLLNAVQSDGIYGVWSSSSNVVPEDPEEKITEVVSLEPGANAFTWTVSTKECAAYDTDTVWVFVPFPPIAIEDSMNIMESKKLNILENDLTANGAFILTLQDTTNKFVIADNNGLLKYIGKTDQLPLTIQYKLCSIQCPALCTSASILIYNDTTDIHYNPSIIVPNAISPNGDGINEVLEFPQLDIVKYANAKLIIFDRSGRVVYTNKHYQNDWNGVGNDQQELLTDTYYYVLWISLSDGLSMKGSVTVLR